MLFVIFCIDKPGMEEKRAAAMKPHVDYLATGVIKLVMSGPLTSDDGEKVIGSLYVVEAENRAEIEEFQKKRPARPGRYLGNARSPRLQQARR